MRKRYRLLKDLPNAKAGDIFEQTEDGGLLFQGSDKSAGVYYKKEEVIVFDLRNPDKGWFEEVKTSERLYIINALCVEGYLSYSKEDYPLTTSRAEKLGIGFKTEEEAEEAVKKLKALTRLKNAGFRFTRLTFDGKWNDGSEGFEMYAKTPPGVTVDSADVKLLFEEKE